MSSNTANRDPRKSATGLSEAAPERACPESVERTSSRRAWAFDLGRVLIVWGLALAATLPFLWIFRQRAPELVEMIKTRDPGSARVRSEAYYARGKLRYLEGKYGEAAFYLDKAYRTNPTLADARYYLGMIHKRKQEWPQAIGDFEATLLENSRHFRARFELADILATQGKSYRATQGLLTLEDLLPKDSLVRRDLPLRERLVPLARELLLENPNHPQALLVTAQEAVRRQNLEEAEQVYTRVLELYPENQAALWGLVEISEKREDPAQTVERLANVITQYRAWVALYDRLQRQVEKAGLSARGTTAGLFQQLDRLRPQHRLQGPWRSGMQLSGFDLIPLPSVYLNYFAVQLHWTQEQGLVWEGERARPIHRLQENLFARQEKIFELIEDNLVPNPGFECSESGAALPAEWPGEYFHRRDVTEGWLRVIEEELPSQKSNRYVRLDASALEAPAPIGLFSRRFDAKPNQTYLLGIRLRSRGGTPHVLVRWQESEEEVVEVQRFPLRFRTDEWELQHVILTSPPQGVLANIVLSEVSGEGIVDFDDLFLIELEGVD